MESGWYVIWFDRLGEGHRVLFHDLGEANRMAKAIGGVVREKPQAGEGSWDTVEK